MNCPFDSKVDCPYTEKMLDYDPELCLYCDPDFFMEDDKK